MIATRYETPEHVLCDASTNGAIPFVAGGPQPDGTYLYKPDLDQHSDDQDAAGMLAYVLRHIPAELRARLHIRPSKRGGFHIPIRTTRPLCAVKIYDPRNGVYAGEICDQRIEVDTCPAEEIPLLSTDELRTLLYYIHAPGAMGELPQTAEAAAAAADTHRKARIREGEQLIAGWGRIRDWRPRLDALCDARPMLATKRAALRTAIDRSTAYSAFVHSLMLHAMVLGCSTEERCRMVAAMAIGTGANGKEQDNDYRIERDTAALIAKIIHGDAMQPRADGTIPHWLTPAWVKGRTLAPAPAPEPPKPPTTRATVRRDLRLAALRRKLSAIEPDEWGRRRFLIERVSSAPRRTAQADLKWLRDQGEITTAQIDGNGQPYAILLPGFGGAKTCKKPDTASVNPAEVWGASAEPAERAPMPDTADQTAYTIEEEEHLKSAPLPDGLTFWLGGACYDPRDDTSAGGTLRLAPAGTQVLGAPPLAPAGAPASALPPASYGRSIIARARRIPRTPPKFAAMRSKSLRNIRFRDLAADDPDLLAAYHWRLKRRMGRKMSKAQAEQLAAIVAEMEFYLGRAGQTPPPPSPLPLADLPATAQNRTNDHDSRISGGDAQSH